MALKVYANLADGPIDNTGVMSEPILWRSREHRTEGNTFLTDPPGFGYRRDRPDFLGYIWSADTSEATYWYTFGIGNYGSEIWRSNPNANSNTGEIEPFYVKTMDTDADRIQTKALTSNHKIAAPGGTGQTSGRHLAVGQGLCMIGNPRLGINGPVQAHYLMRQGPVKNYLETSYDKYSYNTMEDAQISARINRGTAGIDTGRYHIGGSTDGAPRLDGFGTPQVQSLNLISGCLRQYAIGCDRVVVADHNNTGDSSTRRGKVWVYDIGGSNLIAEIENPELNNGSVTQSGFGWSVCIADGFIFVSDPKYRHSSSSTQYDQGRVYIFDLQGTLVYTLNPKDMSNIYSPVDNVSKTPTNLYAETASENSFGNFPWTSTYLQQADLRFGSSIAAGSGKLVVGFNALKYFNSSGRGPVSGTTATESGGAMVFYYGEAPKGSEDPDNGYGGSAYNWESNFIGAQLKPAGWMLPYWYLDKAYHGEQSIRYGSHEAGYNVAISSQYILVSAPNYNSSSGMVLIFDHEMTYLGKWNSPINNYNTASGHSHSTTSHFGRVLEAQGNTILAGSTAGWAAVYTHSQYINIHDAIALENGWF